MIDRTGSAVFVNSDGAPGFGGVSSKAPAVALVAGVMVASLLGFPGLGGFVGQALVIIGSYTIHPAVVLLTGCALVLATYYLFTMYRHVFLGRPGPDISSFYDLTLRERAYLIPLVCTLVVFGVYPKPLIELVRPTILILLSTIK
jgi:NADH-quinone oxidoreductase subunit M